jgi:hypothetical protein
MASFGCGFYKFADQKQATFDAPNYSFFIIPMAEAMR